MLFLPPGFLFSFFFSFPCHSHRITSEISSFIWWTGFFAVVSSTHAPPPSYSMCEYICMYICSFVSLASATKKKKKVNWTIFRNLTRTLNDFYQSRREWMKRNRKKMVAKKIEERLNGQRTATQKIWYKLQSYMWSIPYIYVITYIQQFIMDGIQVHIYGIYFCRKPWKLMWSYRIFNMIFISHLLL